MVSWSAEATVPEVPGGSATVTTDDAATTITFESVEAAGATMVTVYAVPPEAAPAPPQGFEFADNYYDVRAIDRYGAESDPATLRVAVGEAQPLAAPVLRGTTQAGGTNLLTWEHAGALGFVIRGEAFVALAVLSRLAGVPAPSVATRSRRPPVD